MSDDELLETYRAAVNRAMSEAHARDGFASNMSRESIVAGLRAVFDTSKGETQWGVAFRLSNGLLFVDEAVNEKDAHFRAENSSVYDLVVSRKSNPWLPVPDTTNNERRAEHDLDRMGICTRCGHGITARELLDGDEQCTINNESEDKR